MRMKYTVNTIDRVSKVSEWVHGSVKSKCEDTLPLQFTGGRKQTLCADTMGV